jgi:hypothetical protein
MTHETIHSGLPWLASYQVAGLNPSTSWNGGVPGVLHWFEARPRLALAADYIY